MLPQTATKLTRRSLFSQAALALGGAITLPRRSPLLALSAEQSGAADLPERVSLRIVVLQSLSEAQQIVQRLRNGDDFVSLAAEKSIDPTASKGGDLGVLDPSILRPELRAALKGLKPGEISSIVQIPEGYAILKFDGQVSAKSTDDNSSMLLALTGPGAVRYGPDVDGYGEAWSIFFKYEDKPKDWDREIKPIAVTEVHQRSLNSAIKQLQDILASGLDGATPQNIVQLRYILAQIYAFRGEMGMAIDQWELCSQLCQPMDPPKAHYLEEVLGIAYLHKSEMENRVYLEPGEKCLFPMSSTMPYTQTADSEKALEHLQRFLRDSPNDLEAKWLLNLTCMTLGKYPGAVPPDHLIPLSRFESKDAVGKFVDVAPEAGLKVFSNAGSIIVDDFENHGLFDIVLSEMDFQNSEVTLRYFHNNGNGTFDDQTERSGLKGELGGLNIIQTDYNNDGCLDILVPRGAWVYPVPMSLFRGNGGGTFEDVTRQAGLTALASTQAVVWADINNDGYLDLFVGNERGPSHLFLNKGDGTFEDISAASGVDRIAFTKGVVAGDYDNDGHVDFYVTNMGNSNFLYHNEGNNTFKEVAREAGVRDPLGESFATWFFDYDNDGWLDLFVTSYYSGSVDENIRTYLGLPPNAVTLKLYKNMRDGTFDDVTADVGLNKVFMPMGANFGDVDNDGFLDIYLGTGNPSYGSLVPNVLLRNNQGRTFVDVTASSGTGELHKGHGTAFADMSNTGQQDILTVIGGATPGDKHALRYFKNPGNDNDWIRIKLVGAKSNRAAVGARIKVSVENATSGLRSICRTVGSGGSFGANPYEQHIGLGPAARIDQIEITWPASGTKQLFTNVRANQVIEIKEFSTQFTSLHRPKIPWPKRV